jgi:LmbE family N-acetylglucosaminyl deacetylase
MSDAQLKRVLGVFAHPDDPEFFCGATFARWSSEGAQVTFLLATSGDKGSDDRDMTPERLIAMRENEERCAAAALGVHDVIFLRYADGELTPSLELRRDIVRVIRLRQPDIVVTNDPTVVWYPNRGINHADHRAIGYATLDAIFPAARNPMYFPELLHNEGLEPHIVKQVYIVRSLNPTTKVDVTAYIDAKIRALREHKSQIVDMDAMEKRMREYTDPEAPNDAPHYTESFHVITYE